MRFFVCQSVVRQPVVRQRVVRIPFSLMAGIFSRENVKRFDVFLSAAFLGLLHEVSTALVPCTTYGAKLAN